MKSNDRRPREWVIIGNWDWFTGGIVLGLLAFCSSVRGQDAGESREGVTVLEEVVVRDSGAREPLLAPAVDQETGQIRAAKKSTTTNIADLPDAPSSDVRQIFSRTPGVYVSEIGDPSVVNLTIRGIGEPHESQDVLVLQDGIPIQSTLIGYPTLYYLPPTELLESVEVIKGGSSLLYGPHPTGAILFNTKDPVAGDPFELTTTNLVGSNEMVSFYLSASGSTDVAGYRGSIYYRQGDGFRETNSDYELYSAHARLFWDVSLDTRLTFDFTAYEEETAEAGRLTLSEWQANDRQVQPGNRDDRLFLRKYFGAFTLDHQFSDSLRVTSKTYAHYQQRKTRRDNSSRTRTDIDDRLFRSIGNDTRFTIESEFMGGELLNITTAGFTAYYSDDPNRRNRFSGGTTTANSGLPPFQHQERETYYAALFAESLFEYGSWRLIPSFRLDYVETSQRNTIGNAGVSASNSEVVPLFGFGIEYDVTPENTAYFNFSQGYQPLQYDQILPRGAASPNPGADPGTTLTYELGIKGQPAPWLIYDTSLFYVDYRDFVDVNEDGSSNLIFLNAGDARFFGLDLAFDLNASNLIDSILVSDYEERFGSFGFFMAAEFLHTEFSSGPFAGNEATYAPAYSLKFGPTYRHPSGVKVDLIATYVDDSFWNSRNARSFTPGGTDVGTASIPAYGIWDLNVEVPVYRDTFKVVCGITNIFDEKYYSRVRADGIQPVAGRQFYVGFNGTF